MNPMRFDVEQPFSPLATRLLCIHIDSVTRAAGSRRRKHRYGVSLTLALGLLALTLVVFGRGMA